MSVLITTSPSDLTAQERQCLYPIIVCEIQELRGWYPPHRFVLPSCCFHDLFEDFTIRPKWRRTIAGMGLAIIGNICRLMREAETSDPPHRYEPSLWLVMARGAEPIRLPWPGMDDDNLLLPLDGLTLDPDRLPFEPVMFLNDERHFQRRVDRLALMHRVEDMWVPFLEHRLETTV